MVWPRSRPRNRPTNIRGVLILVFAVVLVGAAGAGLARAAPPTRGAPAAQTISFEQALALAQAASESLAASSATHEAAQARVQSARSAYLPQIDASASYQRTIRSEFEDLFGGAGGAAGGLGSLPFAQKNAWRAGLTGRWALWTGGRTSASVRAAKAGAAGAKAQLDSLRAQVVLDTAEAYYEAALAQRLVEISEATLTQAEEALRSTQVSFSAGKAPEFDVLRAEVARDNQQTLVITTRSQRVVAGARLRRLIGLRDDIPLVLSSTIDADDLQLVDRAAQRRAGIVAGAPRAPIREAVAFSEARAADLDLARAEWLPTLALTSDLGVVNYPAHVWFDRDTDDWRTNFSVMVVASYPLFTGFRRTADVRAARALVVASRARLSETQELSHLADVEVTEHVTSAEATLRQTGRTVEQATRAYQLAEIRYQEGVATHLDLIDARVQLQQSRVNQARAARDLRLARIRLALLPALPVTLPSTFVITTESGTGAVPAVPRAPTPVTPGLPQSGAPTPAVPGQ